MHLLCVFVCVLSSHLLWTSVYAFRIEQGAPTRVTQQEGLKTLPGIYFFIFYVLKIKNKGECRRIKMEKKLDFVVGPVCRDPCRCAQLMTEMCRLASGIDEMTTRTHTYTRTRLLLTGKSNRGDVDSFYARLDGVTRV